MSLSVAECLREAIIGRVFSQTTWSILFLNRPTAVTISTLFRKSQILKKKILTILRTENENYPDGMEKFDVIYFVYLDKNTIKNIKRDIDQKRFKKYRIVYTGWSGHTGQMFSRTKNSHSMDVSLEEVKHLFIKQNETSDLTIVPFKLDCNILNDHVFTPITHIGTVKENKDLHFVDQNILHRTIQSICRSFRMAPRIINLTHYQVEQFTDSGEHSEISDELIGISPICLLLDRRADPNTPFLHFFEFETYLSDLGVIDLKGIPDKEEPEGKTNEENTKKNTVKQSNKNIKLVEKITALRKNNLWLNLRHLHLAELNTYLIEEAHKLNEEMAVIGGNQVKEISENNNGKSQNNSPSLSSLRAAVLSAPSLIAKKQSLDTAITLCEKALGQFPKIENIALREQELVERKNVIPQIISLIVDQKTETLYDQSTKSPISYPVSRANCIRLLFLLYLNNFNLTVPQLKRITDKLLLSEKEISKIMNVKENMIFKVQRDDSGLTQTDNKPLINQFKKFCKKDKWKYQVSRYTPLVVQLVDSIIIKSGPVYEQALERTSNKIEMHSLRKTSNRNTLKSGRSKLSTKNTKLVIVSIPYLTISELVLLRRLSEIRNFTIWICTNEIINQGEMVNKIME